MSKTKFDTTSNYILNSGEVSQEISRLTFQNDMFIRMTSTLLPPEISTHLSQLENPKIADIATGTGIWTHALSQLYPEAKIDGSDFDISKFPQPSPYSSNTTLSFANILDLSSFPQEKVGTYDLVHVRLLSFGLLAHQWPEAVRNLQMLLKSGGWLLWEETGYTSWVTLPPCRSWYRILESDVRYVEYSPFLQKSLAHREALSNITDFVTCSFAQKAGRDITFPLRLPSWIQDAGFQDVKVKNHNSLVLERHDDVKEALVLVLQQALLGIVERGGFGEVQKKEDAEKLISDLRADLLGEEHMAGFELMWVWGRKGV
jgi:ubiquinone/menaquinone biosynthesis C-methylase UbiE